VLRAAQTAPTTLIAELERSAKNNMNQEDNLIVYPIPSLVATLLNREQAKGSPLTEEEVLAIRDTAPSVAVTREEAAKVDEGRGYLDIDPENCWAEWQRARIELNQN
jgi:hypothetical protein